MNVVVAQALVSLYLRSKGRDPVERLATMAKYQKQHVV